MTQFDDLPTRWQTKVVNELGLQQPKLSIDNFLTTKRVVINFDDNSKVEFNYAFVIKAPEFRELAVFTEHCGYHLFRFYDGIDLQEFDIE